MPKRLALFTMTIPSGMMPPTPPDHHATYMDRCYRSSQLCNLRAGGRGASACRYDMGAQGAQEDHLIAKEYSQYSVALLPQPAYLPESKCHGSSAYAAPLQDASRAYGALSAPLLPPIRVQDRLRDDFDPRSRRASTVTQPKEEKLGGVAAHLDYEMDEMVDFVSEMAQGMYGYYASKICLADIDMIRSVVSSNSPVQPDFRKYVLQVLSSTRLPSSTILIGLHYLANRMNLLSTRGRYTYGSGDVYHMLTIALLLGSKFLDDNTFQNRSWSEVSNIAVSELNMLEIEWLVDINWDMHIDPHDPEGFLLWHQIWKRFHAKKVDMSLAESMKQTHLEAIPQSQSSMHQALSSVNRYAAPYSDHGVGNGFGDRTIPRYAPRYDQWPPSRSHTDYSPPSAPETGPNTPDSYGMHGGFGYGYLPPIHTSLKMPPSLQIVPTNASQSGYLTPYTPQYSQYGHGSHCGCSYCLSPHDRYFMAPGYGPQLVAG